MNTLQAKLARSLDRANKQPRPRGKQKALAPLPPEKKCSKLSVSLFSGDLSRLEEVRSYMAERGHRISTSQAVKLALRTCTIGPALEEALQAVRAEDGRRW